MVVYYYMKITLLRCTPVRRLRSFKEYVIYNHNGVRIVSFLRDIDDIKKVLDNKNTLSTISCFIEDSDKVTNELSDLCDHYIDKDGEMKKGFSPSWIESWEEEKEYIIYYVDNNDDPQAINVCKVNDIISLT